MVSKSSSASIGNWSEGDTLDIIDLVYSKTEAGGTTLDDFEAECPCCGQIMVFRLSVKAIALEAEKDR